MWGPPGEGFNSRSRGGSDPSRPSSRRPTKCFNSRSRGGSDSACLSLRIRLPVFQFTLPRGERQAVDNIQPDCERFQFTLPRGERLNGVYTLVVQLEVSIHAPAGGATRQSSSSSRSPACFNSRSRGGSDSCSRSPRPPGLCFNSRSRGGSDPSCRCNKRLIYVSIHAPAGGATWTSVAFEDE